MSGPSEANSSDASHAPEAAALVSVAPNVEKADGKKLSASSWQDLTGSLSHWQRFAPIRWLATSLTSWFSVSEANVVEILEQVRSELPTTEALLVGKPQAGKSSIVRGLTGVSADIVGQGFRPHTQHTQRYSYPTHDLPLLIFTDTVGLGDVSQDTETITQELIGELQSDEDRRARVLLSNRQGERFCDRHAASNCQPTPQAASRCALFAGGHFSPRAVSSRIE